MDESTPSFNVLIKTGQNKQIQILRFLFCFLIVFFHFAVRYCQIYLVNSIFLNDFFSAFSSIGIIGFFILTGFFLIRRKPIETVGSKLKYWVIRFLNIYLPYIVAISTIYLFSLTGLLGEERSVTFATYVQNLFFVNLFTNNGYVDGAHWYIISLFTLYFLCIIYDLVFKNKGVIFWTVLIVISLIAAIMQNFDLGSLGKIIN